MNLIVGGIAMRQSQVIVLALHVKVGKDELVLDHLPNDPGHLVSIHLHHRLGHLDSLARRVCQKTESDAQSKKDSKSWLTISTVGMVHHQGRGRGGGGLRHPGGHGHLSGQPEGHVSKRQMHLLVSKNGKGLREMRQSRCGSASVFEEVSW